MIFALLTLLAALALAAVAGWFSIIGLMAIMAGQPIAALVLGITLEAGKLVTTSWLYRNWNEAGWGLKAPLVYFTLALMVATSMGAYGFLSKAHLEQGASTMDNSSKIARMEQQISREKSLIADNDKVILQLDATVNSFLGKDRTDRALSVRKSQLSQRKQLKDDSEAAQKRIEAINDEKFKLESDLRKLELEVGPIRYIAELIYGAENSDNKTLESAVRIFTLIIVSTLDPLAITLLIAANFTILRIQNEKKKKQEDTKETPSGHINSDYNVGAENESHNNSTPEDSFKPLSSKSVSPPISSAGNRAFAAPPVTGDEKAALYAPLSLEVVEGIDETKKDEESVWETWTIQDEPPNEAAKIDGEEILVSSIWQTPEKTEILNEEVTDILSQEPITPIERSAIIPLEARQDTDEETVQHITEPEEVGISEEEKATLASWLLRGQNYAGVRQPAPTQVISNTDAAVETTADIPQIGKTDSDVAALQVEVSPGRSMVVPWAYQANVYRELVGDAHFIPQKVNEETIQEELVPHATETGPASAGIIQLSAQTVDGEVKDSPVDSMALQEFSKASGQLAQTAKYPKTLSWLTEFRRD